ncbi:MAG: alpha/beta hydrolase [Acidobacteria bacterium]|nr:alpha/beta hydrolase [Acidobacteriota bacterium]
MEERWARLSAGKMRYLAGGEGHPLVLVHGIAASSFSFRLNCEELARHFRVFVPDFLAITSAASLPASLAANALRLKEFLDSVGIDKGHILGSSYGGAVVMELASLAMDRFTTMVLVSPANPFARRYHRVVRFYLSPLGGAFIRVVPYLPGWAWDYGIGRMYSDPSTMSANTGLGYAQPLRIAGMPRRILAALGTFTADVEALRARLTGLASIPSLIIWGNRDPVVELESAYPLQEQLRARLVVMNGIGHLPYEERPPEFNEILRDFLLT